MDSVCSPGLMSTVSRSEWFTSTRTASRSHVLMLTSPAKLLTSSFVPFVTLTVWSVVARAAAKSIAAIMTVPLSLSAFSCQLVRFVRERRRAPEEIQLPPPRLDEMSTEITVRRIRLERLPRLFDRLVDDLQVVFDDRDGRLVQAGTAALQRLLQVADRCVVLRVREAHPCRHGRRGRHVERFDGRRTLGFHLRVLRFGGLALRRC